MAFVKTIMIAAMPLFASSFVLNSPEQLGSKTFARDTLQLSDSSRSETHGHSTFYKNQATPEFLLRQLPSAKTEMFFDPSNSTTILEHRKYLEV